MTNVNETETKTEDKPKVQRRRLTLDEKEARARESLRQVEEKRVGQLRALHQAAGDALGAFIDHAASMKRTDVADSAKSIRSELAELKV